MHTGQRELKMGSTSSTTCRVLQKRSTMLSSMIVFSLLASAYAQDENDDSPPVDFRPGLLAEFTSGDASVRQVVSVASLNDAPKNMTVRWTGRLFVRYGDRFAFRPYGCGDVTFTINSEQVLSGKNATTGWYDPATVELEYGWHPVEIVCRTSRDNSRFGMYWSSDQFLLEPITAWVHQPSEGESKSDWEEGRRHVKDLGCANCHEISNVDGPALAPTLHNLAGNMNARWLAEYLASGRHGAEGRAPELNLDRAQADALAHALCEDKPGRTVDSPSAGDDRRGEELFHTVGCLACHAIDDVGTVDAGGGDLSNVGDKRTRSFFTKWLSEPALVNEDHQMPQFDLTDNEVRDLTEFLSQRHSGTKLSAPKAAATGSARTLLAGKNCAACHKMPSEFASIENSRRRTRLTAESDWSNSCVGPAKKGRPNYSVRSATRRAINEFVAVSEKLPPPLAGFLFAPVDGSELMRAQNCLGCHSRGEHNGLRDASEQAASKLPDLQQHLSAMSPPSLNSVGDKLTDEAIANAIKREGGSRRPWKHVQMPRFNLNQSEISAIVKTLVKEDRVPPVPAVGTDRESVPDDRRKFVAGSRLVTSDGFGCTSCHKIGKTEPNKAPTHLLGPDLSMLGDRIREPWFRRWLKNPANIVPRVEMPSVQHPVRGLLEENLSHQIGATWHVLNQKRFDPPLPNPVRIVRHSGVSESSGRAHVLTDVMRYDGHSLIKPFAIGLANRHNILLDLQHGRLLDWSIGDTAKQRTQGKTWFWQWAGNSLMANERNDQAMISLVIDGKRISPSRTGQFVSEPHRWDHEGVALKLSRQLTFTIDGSPSHVWLSETFSPLVGDEGFTRTIEFSQLPPGAAALVTLLDQDKQCRAIDSGIEWKLDHGPKLTAIVSSRQTEFDVAGTTVRCGERDSRAVVRIEYTSSVAPNEPFEFDAPVRDATGPQPVSVVPGFNAVRLVNDHEFMPTAFAWNGAGDLFVASLKGRVWRFPSGGEDESSFHGFPISDELAAPFGIVARGDQLDVITKGGLLRLTDTDGDRRTDVTQTIASGWGHTDDYHDWAIGLPTDDAGNYFASIACQQDDRSEAAAHMRGKVVKLSPRKASPGNPHLFEVSEVTGGHRFAIGIARSKRGDLFVSDNQGNFNPYNELNHVRPGLRYGFINQLEKSKLDNRPLTSPSINIPHPWTRSVNGICFLEQATESAEVNESNANGFGPFEGHLVGCEYDTRRLVRMSLQRVGNTYQGAIYPFSRVEHGTENPLLGPVSCAVSPSGSLFIGEMRDSGWGAGNNTGQVVRLRYSESDLPCGIAEVRAVSNGFEIEFTQPIDVAKARDRRNYEISSATRISTPAYGGDDRDRRRETIRQIIVSEREGGGLPIVRIEMEDLRIGYVYDFHLKSIAPADLDFFPAEAYYSLNALVP